MEEVYEFKSGIIFSPEFQIKNSFSSDLKSWRRRDKV